MNWAWANLFIFPLVWIPDPKLTCLSADHMVRWLGSYSPDCLSRQQQIPAFSMGLLVLVKQNSARRRLGEYQQRASLSCWAGWSVVAGFHILCGAICLTPVLCWQSALLLQCFTIPGLKHLVLHQNVSPLIILSVSDSLSLCSTHRLLHVVHKNIKHLHCVGPIWVLPWWLHALKFSHKVRRVSTRYSSLLIVSICLQRCCWVWGLDWDVYKERLRPDQALLS